MRIPLATSLKIQKFIGGLITVARSRIINGVLDRSADGNWFLTQRPPINIAIDASADSVTTGKGRGVYDWDVVDATYWVNGSEVYKGTHSTTVREAELSVTNLTQTTGTATATCTNTYAAGDSVVVSGASPAGYNGTVTVLTASGSDFTYAVDSGLSSPATGTIVARRTFKDGTGKIYFMAAGDHLAILDPDNNEGWYIDQSTSTTLAKIENANFPANISGKTLGKGGGVLNKRGYVTDTDGTIYGSGSEDLSSWSALNFTEAELQQDGNVAVWLHEQHIVSLGVRTLEFFYDNANPTGSPLSVRTDVSYLIGCADEHSIASESGMLFFLGITEHGEIGAYMMSGMQPRKISKPDHDSFITSTILKEGKSVFGTAFSVGGRIFYLLTFYHLNSGTVTPLTTLVYNATSDTCTTWDLMHDGIEQAPIIDMVLTTSTTDPQGILTNGDIIAVADDFLPQDRVLASAWVEDGWVEPGWVARTSQTGTNIQLSVVTGPFDAGTNEYKFSERYRLVATQTEEAQAVSLYWSDETNNAYGAAESLDLSDIGMSVNAGGKFRRRNHKLVTAPSERVEIEALEMDGEVGS